MCLSKICRPCISEFRCRADENIGPNRRLREKFFAFSASDNCWIYVAARFAYAGWIPFLMLSPHRWAQTSTNRGSLPDIPIWRSRWGPPTLWEREMEAAIGSKKENAQK